MVQKEAPTFEQFSMLDENLQPAELPLDVREPETIVADVHEHKVAILGVLQYGKNLNKNIEFQEKIEDPRSPSYYAIMRKKSPRPQRDA